MKFKFNKYQILFIIIFLLLYYSCGKWDFSDTTVTVTVDEFTFKESVWPDTLIIGTKRLARIDFIHEDGTIDSSGEAGTYIWRVSSNKVLGLSWAGQGNKRFIHGFNIGRDLVEILIIIEMGDGYDIILYHNKREVVVVDSSSSSIF